MNLPIAATESRRRRLAAAVLAIGVIATFFIYIVTRFPPDTEPGGAYLRIAASLANEQPQDIFAYLEEDAQIACYTILNYAKKSATTIRERYPKEHRAKALPRYATLAKHKTPAALWVAMAKKKGWLLKLRADLSGIADIQVVGPRATVLTARGTRYPFRRRPNKIWGLTLFTAELDALAQKLARDWDVIQGAAKDFSEPARSSIAAPTRANN